MDVKIRILWLSILILIGISCGNRRGVDGCKYVPASFNIPINLNDINYSPLMFDNRYMYHAGGIKGLIIYRASATEYRVFERASPLDPNSEKAKLFVDGSGTLMQDTVHQQSWDMAGTPYIGASSCQVYKYQATLDGSYLNITSY